MTPFLKSLAQTIPAVRKHFARVDELHAERDRYAWHAARAGEERNRLETELAALSAQRDQLAGERDQLASQLAAMGESPRKPYDWSELKERKRRVSEEVRSTAVTSRISRYIDPAANHLQTPVEEWIRQQVQAEPYWFQKVEVLPGFFTSGWSDPSVEKLPYYGLPEDLTGMRVLDIGCAEGFFSFEAERRGAREVIGIDSFPDSIRRFNIVKSARQSNATAYLMNVYDLEPKRLGTFDLVLFYGVFYHLKHPQYALERIRSICSGDLRFQTHIYEDPAIKGTPWARFYPYGYMSGSNQESWDPTVFWLFNPACCVAMLDHVGFTDIKILANEPKPFVVSAASPERSPGVPPDQTEAPWS
jgi:2-polyprenyl-3-methyl-5-hydroxy-6-metoxy-1,4-benzoquinol methylase